MKFKFTINIKEGADKDVRYYIGQIPNTPFIVQGKNEDDCVKRVLDQIAGFIETFPDYKNDFKMYGITDDCSHYDREEIDLTSTKRITRCKDCGEEINE